MAPDGGGKRTRKRHLPCELCHNLACLFCEADQARLCWQCDAQVHSANFLVARHTRSILCSACEKPTLRIKAGPCIQPRPGELCAECRSRQATAEPRAVDRDADDDHELNGKSCMNPDDVDHYGARDDENKGETCGISDRDDASCQSSVSSAHHHPPLVSKETLKYAAGRQGLLLAMEEGTGDSEDQTYQPGPLEASSVHGGIHVRHSFKRRKLSSIFRN